MFEYSIKYRVPARLSSLWFGNNEMSMATSIGVFGNQFGTALGFLIPPAVIPNNGSIDDTTTSLYYFLISVAVVCTIVFILSLFGKLKAQSNSTENIQIIVSFFLFCLPLSY
jgi:hypothetical protein